MFCRLILLVYRGLFINERVNCLIMKLPRML